MLSASALVGFAMARQPINSRFSEPSLGFGPGFLAQRPKAAALIAQCITTWTEVELQTARLLAAMWNANSEPVVALYLSLANARAKREALDAIASFVFSGEQTTLYEAVMRAKQSIEKQRVDLAHGLFGIVSEDPEGVVMISTTNRLKHMLDIDIKRTSIGVTADDFHTIRDLTFHYTINDLETILCETQHIHNIIMRFSGYAVMVINRLNGAELLFQTLLNEPLVQRFLFPSASSPKNGT